MDLIAIKPNAQSHNGHQLQISQLSNKAQEDAFEYGSAFSRGAVIKNCDLSIIQLSGTASIDEQGKTIFIDDPEKQIRCTFEKIAALLSQEQITLQDLCSACVFVKNAEYEALFKQIAKEYNLEDWPAITMVADVCRDDLLFEIDAEGIF